MNNTLIGNYVIQKYIENPLILNQKKFDIRCFGFLVSTKPFILLFKHGYIRNTINDYDLKSQDLSVHLTNHFVQKNLENY